MKDFKLFLVWLILFQIFSYLLCISSPKGPRVALAGLCFVWCGLLIAISFTEAWVKFRSRLLERHVALDVGRLVFSALNALEMALSLTTLTILFQYEPYVESMWGLPVALQIILFLQAFYLTPKLNLRAIFIETEELFQKKHARKIEETIYKEFKALTTLQVLPSTNLHHLYVILEFVKVGLLLKYSTDLLLISI